MRYLYVCLLCISFLLGIAGCKSSGSSAGASGVIARPSAQNDTPGGAGPALTISGSAAPEAKVGEPYSFKPKLASFGGRGHTFTVENLPGWLQFNSRTGEVKGVPKENDIGSHDGISISVYDGFQSKALAPFGIKVVSTGNLSIQLSWYPPEENVDGSPLFDLAGYSIRYGREPGNPIRTIHVGDPFTTSYLVEGLIAGTYYFTMSAYNSLGISSEPSPEAPVVLR